MLICSATGLLARISAPAEPAPCAGLTLIAPGAVGLAPSDRVNSSRASFKLSALMASVMVPLLPLPTRSVAPVSAAPTPAG